MEFLKGPAGDTPLVYIDPTEFITTYFKVALLGGFILAMPVVLYQMVMFAAPGLTPREKRYVLVSVPRHHPLLCRRCSVCLVRPNSPALNFLLNFGGDVAEANIRIGRYINLILALTLWVGLSFQRLSS